MFVIIDMSNNQRRLFEKYRRHEIELKRHDVHSCAPFFVASCHRNYTDFDKLRAIVERYGVALFARDTQVPQQLVDLEFEPTVLPLKMLIKTVAEHLSRQEKRCDLTVSIIDKSAKAGDVLHYIAKQARYVSVLTSRMDRYEFYTERIYNSMGISVDLTDNLSSLYSSDIIISVDDKELDFFDKSKIISYRKYTQNQNVFTLCESDLFYKKFDCERFGIDKFRFVCALYETCGYHLKEIPIFKDITTLDKVINT